MKFIIDDEKKPVAVRLYLRKDSDRIQLRGSDGKKDRIIISFKDGQFHRHPFANLAGILTNAAGFIKEKEE